MYSYFVKSLRERSDVDLIVCGPYTGQFIPWMGGMMLPVKYAITPEIPLPFPPNIGVVDYEMVKAFLPKDWKPDLVLNIDAGIHWNRKPNEGIVATVATDPHCLNYDIQRTHSDKFFNMQNVYMQKGDVYLPYAVSSEWFYKTASVKDTDAVLIGMPYEQRVQWVTALRAKGISVLFENGPVFDEYRILNNRANLGLNWSSLQDLNCRVFEIMGMGLCPIINRVPDLDLHFSEGIDYLGFTDLGEAVDKVIYVKNHPDEAERIGEHAMWNIINNHHTFVNRVDTLLRECGLI